MGTDGVLGASGEGVLTEWSRRSWGVRSREPSISVAAELKGLGMVLGCDGWEVGA